ncbi:phosphatidylinositol-3,5-bisphosphate 5-phosphatase [Sorochytrium milnesiophthora]
MSVVDGGAAAAAPSIRSVSTEAPAASEGTATVSSPFASGHNGEPEPLRNFAIYETKTRLYIVGNNRKLGRYRIVKIDRTTAPPARPYTQHTAETLDPADAAFFDSSNGSSSTGEDPGISIVDDGVTYTREEIRNLLYMIQQGNKAHGEVRKLCEAVAIAGIVRFLQGYYLVAVTAKTTVAVIGGHHIYRAEETQVIPILNPTIVKMERRPEEAGYVAAFQAVCYQNDFYFSYTYDITRTLQANMQLSCAQAMHCGRCVTPAALLSEQPAAPQSPASMFVWNHHMRRLLLRGFEAGGSQRADLEGICSLWTVTLIQGFVQQAKISVFTKPYYITLIARRSRHFAGARFLRRGVDAYGHVANEVESEQIVHDASATVPPLLVLRCTHSGAADPPTPPTSSDSDTSYDTTTTSMSTTASKPEWICPVCQNQGVSADGKISVKSDDGHPDFVATPQLNRYYTSFVQHRGSIPLYWSQDTGNLAPKPPIQMDKQDPFYAAAALHFDDMFRRYGSPLYVLNLVKTKEKVKREAIIGNELELSVKYLAQFLPESRKIRYQAIDMSRVARTDDVIAVLDKIGQDIVTETGFFSSGPEPYLHTMQRGDGTRLLGRRQRGVVRTNCIDCLDRTNAAAFVFGKCALGHQLHALGVVSEPWVAFDTDVVDILTDMYQSHGDVIALQYGGSNLVNTMESYRNSNFASHSRDMIETLRRYYSNSFTDAEKQAAIDLYLGLYAFPGARRPTIEYVRSSGASVPGSSAASTVTTSSLRSRRSYVTWWTDDPDTSLRRADQPSSDTASARALASQALALRQDHYSTLMTMFAFNMVSNVSRGSIAAALDNPFLVRPRENEIPTMFNIAGLKRWLQPITSSISTENETKPTRTRKESHTSVDTELATQDKQPEDEQKGSRKKAIEGLVERLSDPSVTPAETREYKRYVQQFQNDLALTPSMPMTHATSQMRSHPDYYHFASCVRLSESPSINAINVQEADKVLYEQYVQLGDRLSKQVRDSDLPILPTRLGYGSGMGTIGGGGGVGGGADSIGLNAGGTLLNFGSLGSVPSEMMLPLSVSGDTMGETAVGADPWQTRSEAYSHWLKTGRLKTWKSKRPTK